MRRALEVTRWNVAGESYGTTVAMTLLVRHPQSIRSAVLDSLNPPDAYFDMPWSARVAQARDAFFAACETDPACAAPYPDLAHLTPCVEIDWRLAFEHWGRGYATEAARAALATPLVRPGLPKWSPLPYRATAGR